MRRMHEPDAWMVFRAFLSMEDGINGMGNVTLHYLNDGTGTKTGAETGTKPVP